MEISQQNPFSRASTLHQQHHHHHRTDWLPIPQLAVELSEVPQPRLPVSAHVAIILIANKQSTTKTELTFKLNLPFYIVTWTTTSLIKLFLPSYLSPSFLPSLLLALYPSVAPHHRSTI